MKTIFGLRAAARELGISHVALLRAAHDGRIKRLAGGGFDVEACRIALAKNTNPIKSKSARAQQSARLVHGAVQGGSGTTEELAETLLRKEIALANLREFQFRERAAKLIPVEDVERLWREVVTTVRARILAIPDQVIDRIAAMSDAREIQKFLDEVFRRTLNELSNEFTARSKETPDSQ